MSALKKNMSIPQGVVLAICSLVGSGLLGLPGLAVKVGGVEVAALGWIVSILLSIPLVIIFMQLSLQVRNAGGVATFAGLAIGKWAQTAVSLILAISFAFGIPLGIYMGGMYLQQILGLPHDNLLWLIWAILALSILVNYLGLRPSGWLNTLSVASLIILIALMILAHDHFLSSGMTAYADALQNIDAVSFDSMWAVCAIIFWAFLGWENMSFGSEEVSGEDADASKRAIRWIYLWAFVIVSAIYLSLAVLTAGAAVNGFSVSGVTGLLALLENTRFETIAYALIVLIILANVNAWVFACSRSLYASGKEGILPRYLGSLSADGIPKASVLTTGAVLCLICYLVFDGILPLETGLALVNQNFILVYVLSVVCYLKLNKGWFAYLIGFLGLASCAFLITGFGWLTLIPLALMALGWMLHHYRLRAKQPKPV
ncbi:APC family permease [Psychrobacter sp. FDAARGOS_221]|uniref:APC family permease n=1 Tax=Psychrobacter sp. FDAARGOS_221 TaxID=1975705 RepID=UPI000BB5734A|nr:amino acid permease [Psychrobacter sp. FDAARGOS_221]PNK60296.1 amino acid permease [Psychrobacter sp. FDAARGOS_221]